MSSTPEFIDTYSDDLLYLMDFRESHLTHPGKMVVEFLFQASLSRIFCVVMVGSIEAMLENWKAKDTNNILAPYFIQSSNEERINALTNNFRTNGINVEEKILKQYLAIKYVRNTIIHSRWKENEIELIKQQGFPTDTRNLTNDHLQIMYSVNIEMMKYIASTQIKDLHKLESYTKLPEVKRYFTKSELAGFLWNNLEKIYGLIYEGKEISQSMVDESIYDWNLYKEIVLANFIDFEKIDSSAKILQDLVDNKRYSDINIGYINLDNVNISELENKEVSEAFGKMLNLNKAEIIPFIEAIGIAKKCYERMRNIIASILLERLATSELSTPELNLEKEAQLADKIFKLGRLFYDYAEKR